MTFSLSESDLEDYLFNHPEAINTLSGRKVTGWLARQFRVPSGIIDLLGYVDYAGDKPWIVVVELKSVPMTANAITQVCRYARDVYKILRERDADYYADFDERYVIIRAVIAPGDSVPTELIYEANALEVSLYTFEPKFDLKIEGPWFFTKDKSSRDTEAIREISKNPIFSIFDSADKSLKPFEDYLDSKGEGQ